MLNGVVLSKNACATPDDILRSSGLPNASIQEIAVLINHFSSVIEGPFFLNRQLEKKVYTEYHHGLDKRWSIFVAAPPIIIDDKLEVWDDPTSEFTNTDYKLTLNTDYYIQSAGPNVGNVCIRKRDYPFSSDTNNIKIKYNGGIVKNIPDSGIFEVPEDLHGLCIAQVTAWWQKSKNPSMNLQIVNGVHTGFSGYELLPFVKTALLSRKRVIV